MLEVLTDTAYVGNLPWILAKAKTIDPQLRKILMHAMQQDPRLPQVLVNTTVEIQEQAKPNVRNVNVLLQH